MKTNLSGLTGGDAAKLDRHLKSGRALSDFTIYQRPTNAIAVSEHEDGLGLRPPAAGSAGCLPAVSHCCCPKIRPYPRRTANFSLLLVPLRTSVCKQCFYLRCFEGGCLGPKSRLCLCHECCSLDAAAGGTPYPG